MSQFPPVGDIKLTKASGTYNTYKLELSFGQLEVIRAALQKHHAEPIADELLAMFDYYAQNLPGPGEEKEDVADREKGAKEAEDDFPIPMPPGQETAAGPEDEGGEDDVPTDDLPDLPGGGDRGGEDEGVDDLGAEDEGVAPDSGFPSLDSDGDDGDDGDAEAAANQRVSTPPSE